jgi:hypothetical protein
MFGVGYPPCADRQFIRPFGMGGAQICKPQIKPQPAEEDALRHRSGDGRAFIERRMRDRIEIDMRGEIGKAWRGERR